MDVVSLRDPRRVIPVIQDALETGAPFDICISDIQMPGISGFETARLIRDPKNRIPDIPLIALSSSIKRDAKKCEESGFDGFMTKPLHREKLFQMLERMLGEMKDVTEKDETPRPKIMTKYSVREDMKHSVRILLVEDNPVNQKLARMMLNKAGYQVGVANNGQEAVEKYTASPEYFDLIFMDVQMPEMDGIEATKAIRSHEEQLRVAHYVSRVSDESNDNIIHETRNPRPETRHIPIVAMTAHAMKGDRAKCLAAGMDEYIRKPVKRELVLEIIDKMVLSRKVG